MTFDSTQFRRVLGHFPTGVTVVTAIGDEGPAGMAIGSFTSVSLDPPLVAFFPAKSSDTWRSMRDAGTFCVNVLADTQKEVCGTFASKDLDKFAGIDWTTDATGSPVLPGCVAHIDCEVEAIHDGGDHDIVVGRVRSLAVDDESATPLLFFRGGYGRYEDL